MTEIIMIIILPLIEQLSNTIMWRKMVKITHFGGQIRIMEKARLKIVNNDLCRH